MFLNNLRVILQPGLISTYQFSVRNFTPRRALLYVPADDIKKVQKAYILDTDCIMLDCEDGVALNKKPQARLNIHELLDKGKPVKKRKYDFGVRVNAVNSDLMKEDLSVILSAKQLPDTILLPKVESPEDLKLFSGDLDYYIKSKSKVKLIMGIESAYSLINLAEICKFAKTMEESCKFILKGLLFGSDDFCATMGIQRSESSIEITYARQKVVTVAKAFNLQAIDMVYINYKDFDGLKKQAEEGARLGYTGKQVIHPGQIDIVQKAFMPTQREIDWASGIITEFYKHQQEGSGAFVYKGQMIDMPTMRQAQHIMDLMNAIMVHE